MVSTPPRPPTETGLRGRVQADLTQALKARDDARVQTLRLLQAAVTNEEIARKRAALSDEDIQRVFEREVKRRREAAEAYRKARREDRASAELTEASMISAYLPRPLSDEELERVIREVRAGMPEALGSGAPGSPPRAILGNVMGAVMGKVRGRADGARVRAMVSRVLGTEE